MSKKNILFTLIYVLTIIVLIFMIVGGIISFINDVSTKSDNGNKLEIDSNASGWNGDQNLPNPTIGSTPAIAIPGFDELVFISDSLEQKVNFYNPEVNRCLFRMSLYVENELLWQSGYIAPGSGYYDITLDKPLSDGSYVGYLRVECFKPSGDALNSAKVNFKLTVIKEN